MAEGYQRQEFAWLKDCCNFCFDVLHHKLFSPTASIPAQGVPSADYPLFVTWDKKSQSGHESLRGCIGTLSPVQLLDGLNKYTVQSAFNDRRFSPISAREVPFLKCSVSILYQFEPALNYLDWEIGIHGVTIEFCLSDDPRRVYSATYLPFVAAEQGWNHLETMDSLIRKSGYEGHVTERLRQALKITRFQGSKQSVTFDDYKLKRMQEGAWRWPH
mmetsp:Transcript_5186/g.11923  ORF Transcript_5186/g.11923 Transcript_5186/m.11923 type:complete len:216 (-) Transcript_5186:342-989(-)